MEEVLQQLSIGIGLIFVFFLVYDYFLLHEKISFLLAENERLERELQKIKTRLHIKIT